MGVSCFTTRATRFPLWRHPQGRGSYECSLPSASPRNYRTGGRLSLLQLSMQHCAAMHARNGDPSR